MIHYERIQKDCFWDMSITKSEIDAIVYGDDFRKKAFLFEKILLNSTKLFSDLAIFKKNELTVLLENFKVPSFNSNYIFRRKNLAEVYFLNKPLLIDELKWVA